MRHVAFPGAIDWIGEVGEGNGLTGKSIRGWRGLLLKLSLILSLLLT